MERFEADKKVFHRTCFRCAKCSVILQVGNYSSVDGEFYCKVFDSHLSLFFCEIVLIGNYLVDYGANPFSPPSKLASLSPTLRIERELR